MVYSLLARNGWRKLTERPIHSNGTLHPVQQAFIDHDALQCGYCTPGIIMSCAALLERTAQPNSDDVNVAISGHYCRCGT